jgi:uncharacterized protein YraI
LAVSLLLILPVGVGAAPKSAPRTASAPAVALGGGTYEVRASVFGVPEDGLVGNETSSGHVLQANDHLVALPACTESSCPWLDLDSTNADWAPQTACAESDGYCWVEIVSIDTGECTVAPVLDVGPFFIRDNWWAPRAQRNYDLATGVPASEAASDGADLGYGPGISDRGHDIANTYGFSLGIDLAAGTWGDLGLAVEQGLAMVEVTLLWQAGIDHDDACGAASPGETGESNAATNDNLNLRAGPSLGDEILTVMPAGSRLNVTGAAENGFYPVTYSGETGWASTSYIDLDGGSPGPGESVGFTNDNLNLRVGPSLADSVLEVMPAGSLVILTGDTVNGFHTVRFAGTEGWAHGTYLDTGDVSAAETATTTDRLNLRAGPSTDDEVLTVMPTGATVTIMGEGENGFYPVGYQGQSGWAYSAYLLNDIDQSATVLEALNLRTGPSLDDEVLLVMPAGALVERSGDIENGYAAVSYEGPDGWLDGWAHTSYLD